MTETAQNLYNIITLITKMEDLWTELHGLSISWIFVN